eukprot:m.816731 g.816731  ORF g.816731 m.816731 type:complete len:579 (-) comp59386_c0_seq7:2595-4331(-)
MATRSYAPYADLTEATKFVKQLLTSADTKPAGDDDFDEFTQLAISRQHLALHPTLGIADGSTRLAKSKPCQQLWLQYQIQNERRVIWQKSIFQSLMFAHLGVATSLDEARDQEKEEKRRQEQRVDDANAPDLAFYSFNAVTSLLELSGESPRSTPTTAPSSPVLSSFESRRGLRQEIAPAKTPSMDIDWSLFGEAERLILQEKMRKLEVVLAQEDRDLKSQQIDLYSEKFQETIIANDHRFFHEAEEMICDALPDLDQIPLQQMPLCLKYLHTESFGAMSSKELKGLTAQKSTNTAFNRLIPPLEFKRLRIDDVPAIKGRSLHSASSKNLAEGLPQRLSDGSSATNLLQLVTPSVSPGLASKSPQSFSHPNIASTFDSHGLASETSSSQMPQARHQSASPPPLTIKIKPLQTVPSLHALPLDLCLPSPLPDESRSPSPKPVTSQYSQPSLLCSPFPDSPQDTKAGLLSGFAKSRSSDSSSTKPLSTVPSSAQLAAIFGLLNSVPVSGPDRSLSSSTPLSRSGSQVQPLSSQVSEETLQPSRSDSNRTSTASLVALVSGHPDALLHWEVRSLTHSPITE